MLRKFLAFAFLSLGLAGVAQAQQKAWPAAGFAEIGAETSVPFGWVDFCQRYRGECDLGETRPRDIVLNARAQADLERVNQSVNKSVQSVSDMDHWGVIDRWDYPTDGKGDCEDYVLQKRKMLIQLGYPRQALLITVVKDKQGDGHAVLTVKTTGGEYILDNLEERILDWRKTGYRFVKRQSQTDADMWVSIGAPTAAPSYVSK